MSPRSKLVFQHLAIWGALFALLLAVPARAATGIPRILNHQGRLFDASGNLLGGSGTEYCFRFAIYDDATPGGPDNKLWPSGTPSRMTIPVRNGMFNAGVGDTGAGGDTLDLDFETTDTAYLNVEVATKVGATCADGDGAESFETLSPRKRILSAGYAVNARTVGGYLPAQNASGTQVPVLSSGNLVLGSANPQINATGTSALTLQGGSGTGNVQFFNASNFVSATGTAAFTGNLTIGGVSDFQGFTFTNATGTGNLQIGTLKVTGVTNLSSTLNVSGQSNFASVSSTNLQASGISTLQGITFTNATGTGNLQVATLVTTGAATLDSLTVTTGATIIGLASSTQFRTPSSTIGTLIGTTVSSTNLTFTNATGSGNLRVATLVVTTLASSSEIRSPSGTITNLSFANATGTSLYLSAADSVPLVLNQNGTSSFTRYIDGAGLEQFRVSYEGSVFANGFVAKQMQFSDEFIRTHANVTADAAGGGTTGQGDTFNWGAGELGTCTWSSVADALNGINRQATGAQGSGCLTYFASAALNANLALNANNRPTMVMKLRPSVIGANNLVMVGMMNLNDGATTSTRDGVYFSNESGTTWIGVARAGDNQTSVTCTGQTISTSNYAYLRITAYSSTSVEFFVDNDISDGIDTVSCGVIESSIYVPTSSLAAELLNQQRTGGAAMNLDVDFVRINQDDPVIPGASLPAAAPGPGTGADLAEEIPAFRAAELSSGDVVALYSVVSTTVVKADTAYAPRLYGVIASDPGIILGNGLDDSVRIALAGRVPVKVNLENGPIEIGDWLTSSNEPGVAMKATGHGMVLGRALESFAGGDRNGTILATVEVQERVGDTIAPVITMPSTLSETTSDLFSFLAERAHAFLRISADYIRAGIAAFEKLFAREITILPEGSLILTAGENQMAGQNTIPAGTFGVFISHARVTNASKIFLTPLMEPKSPLAVTEKVPGAGFRVALRETEPNDVPFDWLLVDTYEAAPAAIGVATAPASPEPTPVAPPEPETTTTGTLPVASEPPTEPVVIETPSEPPIAETPPVTVPESEPTPEPAPTGSAPETITP